MIIVLNTDGTRTTLISGIEGDDRDKGLTFKQAQKIVGGLVEMAYLDDCKLGMRAILVNEEGFERLPYNHQASKWFKIDLYGPVILMVGEQIINQVMGE